MRLFSILSLFVTILALSCSKKSDPAPTVSNTNTGSSVPVFTLAGYEIIPLPDSVDAVLTAINSNFRTYPSHSTVFILPSYSATGGIINGHMNTFDYKTVGKITLNDSILSQISSPANCYAFRPGYSLSGSNTWSTPLNWKILGNANFPTTDYQHTLALPTSFTFSSRISDTLYVNSGALTITLDNAISNTDSIFYTLKFPNSSGFITPVTYKKAFTQTSFTFSASEIAGITPTRNASNQNGSVSVTLLNYRTKKINGKNILFVNQTNFSQNILAK